MTEADDLARYEAALREIVEEYAGSEFCEPVYAAEAYAIDVATRMYKLAASVLALGDRPSDE